MFKQMTVVFLLLAVVLLIIGMIAYTIHDIKVVKERLEDDEGDEDDGRILTTSIIICVAVVLAVFAGIAVLLAFT